MTSNDGDNGSTPDGEGDIRPLVAHDPGNRPLWIGVAAIAAVGLLLFYALETKRQTMTAPPVRPRVADLAVSPTAIPPLYIPPEPVRQPVAVDSGSSLSAERSNARLPMQTPQSIIFPQPSNGFAGIQNPPITPVAPPTPPPRSVAVDTSPAIIYDQTQGDGPTVRTAGTAGQAAPPPAVATRIRATRTRARAMTVPQGTLIAAVLETALDSTQPGQARALVSRDVPNLAGGPVLIQRGSRLYGEYRGEIGAGQKRAMIQWSRLETPDGISIAIDSPAADQLGRAGIKGKVNSQFAARLGGALLQSVIDVGAFAAVRSLSDSPFFVAVPGAVQGSSTSSLIGPPPRPTLRVRQGTRISVFVARDLDFSGVGSRK